uniref:Uncharacterized protein n=1 Tax=Pongo abelii TaxID=9601 RepID=A0A8I5YJJ5_PONAB
RRLGRDSKAALDSFDSRRRCLNVSIIIVSFSLNSSPPPPSPIVFPRFPSSSLRSPFFSQHSSLLARLSAFFFPLPTSFPASSSSLPPIFFPSSSLSPRSSSPLSPPFFFSPTRPLPFSLPTLFFPSPPFHRLLPHLLPFPSPLLPDPSPFRTSSHLLLPSSLLPSFFPTAIFLHPLLPSPYCLLPAPSSPPQFFPPSPPFSSPQSLCFLAARVPVAAASPSISFSPPARFQSPPSRLFPQQRLSVAIFFPLSSLPLLIVFFPSLFFSTIFFPSPPFSSRFHLPTTQQRLPAAFFFSRTLFSPLPLPTVFAPDRLLAHPLLALSHCLSPRSSPRMRAPVSPRPVCLCAQAAP